MKTLIQTLIFSVMTLVVSGQMIIGNDTLYGNEWIDHDKTYYKIKLAEDGIYRITYTELAEMGFPVAQTTGQNIIMYSLGQEVPLHLSFNGPLGNSDYIEFVGKKNRGELDEHLYANGKADQLNPEFSLFSDTSVYFLTFDNTTQGKRFLEKGIDAAATPESYYLHNALNVYSEFHHKPTYQGQDLVQYSHFDISEGFGKELDASTDVEFEIENLVETTDLKPRAFLRMGSNGYAHVAEISFNDDLKITDPFYSFAAKEYDIELEYAELQSNNTLNVKGTNSTFDRYSVAFGRLIYPREPSFNADYFEFVVEESAFIKNYEFEVPGNTYTVYDLENENRTVVNSVGGKIKFEVGAGSGYRKILVSINDNFKTIDSSTSKQFVDFSQEDPTFLFLTSKKLYDPNDSDNAVKQYADYRASQAGGAYRTYIATSEEIIDQFAYGIARHNIGSRNFAFFSNTIWDELKYWYNVGKGLGYSSIRFDDDNSLAIINQNHVTSYGAPSSDMLMLSKIDESSPLYNFGRIAATSQQEILEYLDKVKLHDDKSQFGQTYEEKYWMKKIIHLSGGRPSDQQILFNLLENMRGEIEVNKFGGDVTTLRKYSNNNVDNSQASKATALINDGLSIITFFGHSAPGTLDFNLEDPSQYSNGPRFPLILSLGCYAGNIFGKYDDTSSRGISEDFVLEPNKAAIAFMASSGTAYISQQGSTGLKLYELLGSTLHEKSISEALREVILTNATNMTLATRTLMQQTILHGDPAITLSDSPDIDLTIDKSTINTVPEFIDPTLNEFDLFFDIVNIGEHTQDSAHVKIIHYGPEGNIVQETVQQFYTPAFRQEIKVTLNVPDIGVLGKNAIEIIVDFNEELDELPAPMAEQNNSLKALTNDEGYCFYILDNGINPVSPIDFAILNDDCPFELKASTNNAFLGEQKYLLEIDTTELFDSPLLEQTEIVSTGGLISWAPTITKQAGTVYYWRVAQEPSVAGGPTMWNGSSFIYMPTATLGWNQSHYFQYIKNDFETLRIEDDRRWSFASEVKSMRFDLGIGTLNGKWVYVDGVAWGSLNDDSRGNYIGVTCFDPNQLIYFNNSDHPYSDLPTAGDNFIYRMDTPESRKNLMDLLDNVPEGSRTFIYTVMLDDQADWHIEDWESDEAIYSYNLFDKLEENGIENAEVLKTLGNVPFLLAFEKGVGKVAEDYGSNTDDVIEKSYEAFWKLKEGMAKSTTIGPVGSWDKLEWAYSEKEDHDNIFLNVYGIYENGTEELVYGNLDQGTTDLSNLNEIGFMRCRLEINASDSWGSGLLESNRSCPQVDFLRVHYTGIADLAFVTNNAEYNFNADTLFQGAPLSISLPIENYTDFAIGETEMKILLRDEENNDLIDTVLVSPMTSKSTEVVKWTYDTKDLCGDYVYNIILNEAKDPTETNYFNNFGLGSFHIKKDETNPMLDVTFDGIHISDGDVVSSSPNILMCASDENEFLILDDPSLFTITLEHPNNSVEDIDLNDQTITYTAGTSESNKATIMFNPLHLPDGVYKLTVQAKDKSNNESGNNEYCVSFEVVNRKAISNIYNYPNPFSTSTQFVFNITGDFPPENIVINIYTVSGKLVKQILPEELGPLNIGLNRSQYKWNGTDEYGQKLANGTYLYKVLYDNVLFEELETAGDRFFTKGFGKMVIMR